MGSTCCYDTKNDPKLFTFNANQDGQTQPKCLKEKESTKNFIHVESSIYPSLIGY